MLFLNISTDMLNVQHWELFVCIERSTFYNLEHKQLTVIFHCLYKVLTIKSFSWIWQRATSVDLSTFSLMSSSGEANSVLLVSLLMSSNISAALFGRSSSTLVKTLLRWSYLCQLGMFKFNYVISLRLPGNININLWKTKVIISYSNCQHIGFIIRIAVALVGQLLLYDTLDLELSLRWADYFYFLSEVCKIHGRSTTGCRHYENMVVPGHPDIVNSNLWTICYLVHIAYWSSLTRTVNIHVTVLLRQRVTFTSSFLSSLRFW